MTKLCLDVFASKQWSTGLFPENGDRTPFVLKIATRCQYVVKYGRFTNKDQSILCIKQVAGWNSGLIWLEERRNILQFWKLESVTLFKSLYVLRGSAFWWV
jgi:hypothetical protein